ncbi:MULTISPECIES: hypothetical protein [Streptomyces]|uniref:hypothetical protein n=1 Tax=Streptomyces TaxID=1883 RepID=UPI000F793BDE|nr:MULTISPECIES: hypothetical protein [Streptomyces]RSS99689.1 hypothetical protein EF910_34470 [Streptomyces sp. WAC07149]GLX18047.1 hypothetical protein Slala01_16910 [Streptomyces lavendulae subsp. lavendulae]GLX26391.1 hypothetical protein Slala02_22110 [Streptomyces lavendulae subsp. lavendulae]
MPDRRQPDPSTDDNPFAAPPEGRPDQPWQPRQPQRPQGPQDGGGSGGGPGDPGEGGGGPARWDPMDPVQRRARYALLSGMWGFFFGIFGIPSVGLLLGALAMYWGISALRGRPATDADPGGLTALGPAARPQRAAAVSGLVTATLALMLAAGSYALQLAYKDFYVCRDDALTRTAELKCNTLLPDNTLGKILRVQR